MKSVQIDKFGGPEVLVIKDMDIGKPGPKEVLIKNKSIGLNFIDVYHRTGLYPIPLPSGIGLEASGIIEEIGSEVKLFKVGDMIDCVITEIDKEKRRIAISHKLTLENPYQLFMDKFPVGSEIDGIISSSNEYALYVKLGDFEIDGFLHANDLSYLGKPEEELNKYKKGDGLKVKILEIIQMSKQFSRICQRI